MRIRNLFLIGLCIVAAPGVVMSVRTAVSTGSTWTKANEAIVAMRAVSDAQRGADRDRLRGLQAGQPCC